jgi:hypothetical protein
MKRESNKEHYELLKWAVQMLYFNEDKWIEICRIDNYLHNGMKGTHIHTYGTENVKMVDVAFQDARRLTCEIGEKIIKNKFNENVFWVK